MTSSKVCHAGCLCDACERLRLVNRRRSKLNRMGISAMTESAPIRLHIERLIAAGMLPQHVAAAAGLGPATVSEIRRGIRDQIKVETARSLLAVRPQAGRTVPSLGSVRRARALVAIGWTFYEIEARAGLCRGYLRLISERPGGRILADRALTIAETYDELSMTIGPSNRQRSFARNRGWPPPLAYDDIDDPNENPVTDADEKIREVDEAVVLRVLNGDAITSTVDERREIARRWAESGRSMADLARRTGWKPERYWKASA